MARVGAQPGTLSQRCMPCAQIPCTDNAMEDERIAMDARFRGLPARQDAHRTVRWIGTWPCQKQHATPMQRVQSSPMRLQRPPRFG